MPLTLTLKGPLALPVEGESLRPDALGELSALDVGRQTLRVGNGVAELGDLFTIEGDPRSDHLILEGDLRGVRGIGRGMALGTLDVRGDAGSGLGQGMLGGAITVFGSALHGAGMAMKGGLLRINGSAGHGLGGAEPGARLGMRDGVILVHGAIGDDAGLSMRRGLIAVGGPTGSGLGRAMVAGSIFTFGSVGMNPGSGMKRGTLALFGPEPARIPATFAKSGRDRPPFLTIYLRKLLEWGFPLPEGAFSSVLNRYNGDLAEHGQGEILAFMA